MSPHLLALISGRFLGLYFPRHYLSILLFSLLNLKIFVIVIPPHPQELLLVYGAFLHSLLFKDMVFIFILNVYIGLFGICIWTRSIGDNAPLPGPSLLRAGTWRSFALKGPLSAVSGDHFPVPSPLLSMAGGCLKPCSAPTQPCFVPSLSQCGKTLLQRAAPRHEQCGHAKELSKGHPLSLDSENSHV